MNSFFDKDNFDTKDIDSWISSKLEESINLDFKEADALQKTSYYRKELAKDVSAFANSAGGIIIYGIREENHVASSITPIDGTVITKEWIEQVIQTGIQRKIEDLRIFPVRMDNDIKQSLYIVRIPESNLAPHMASASKKFYRRYNFESVAMEEYEVRNLYHRIDNTELLIQNVVKATNGWFYVEEDGKEYHCLSDLSFQIENTGHVIEKDYKLIINLKSRDYYITVPNNRPKSNLNYSFVKDSLVVSFSSVQPIFPGEILTIGTIDLGIPSGNFKKMIDEVNINMELHYSNGVSELELPLSHFFDGVRFTRNS